MHSRLGLVDGQRPEPVADVPTPPRYRWTMPCGGGLDLATAPRTRCYLNEVLTLGHGSVAVDLSALEVIDAAGIRVLREAHKAAQQQGLIFLLVGVAPQIRRLLEILGLGELIDRSAVRPEVATARTMRSMRPWSRNRRSS